LREPFHASTQPAAGSVELSPREQEVLELLARGYLYKEITSSLNVSMGTVNTYIRRIYEKLHVRSRSEAIARYAHISFADRRSSGDARL
jgi:DNA-binding NarL/FixJ family response regulator